MATQPTPRGRPQVGANMRSYRNEEIEAAHTEFKLESIVTVRCAFCGRGVRRRLRLARAWFEAHKGRCKARG